MMIWNIIIYALSILHLSIEIYQVNEEESGNSGEDWVKNKIDSIFKDKQFPLGTGNTFLKDYLRKKKYNSHTVVKHIDW